MEYRVNLGLTYVVNAEDGDDAEYLALKYLAEDWSVSLARSVWVVDPEPA